ncbi:hypothetical protein [Alloactinosynnema sp. L-07]|uniref:hypothetical protein n=1 Tax=Alloactinosynnema sp. L-07 TaxID=1653480 RepID=UPI0006B69B7A|nr:hypothetical protein [Alloactinosynnema sp. L-07]
MGGSEISRDGVGFGYVLPRTPVATATVDIGHVAVTVSLRLEGEIHVTTSAEPAAEARTRSLAALRDVATGVMVGGIGSSSPRITAGAGHAFTQNGRMFRPPNIVAFTGVCDVRYTRVDTEVWGRVGYALDVSALPHREPAVPPWDGSPDARAWFVRHDHELSAVGVMVLVAVPFAPGPLVEVSRR